MTDLNDKLRYTSDGALAECPCCASLDVGGAHDTVHCYRCGLTVTKPRPLQNAIDAWNKRPARATPAPQAAPSDEQVLAIRSAVGRQLNTVGSLTDSGAIEFARAILAAAPASLTPAPQGTASEPAYRIEQGDPVTIWKGKRRIANINGIAFRSAQNEREEAEKIVAALSAASLTQAATSEPVGQADERNAASCPCGTHTKTACVLAGACGQPAPNQGCPLPPAGWYCTREPGHEGPCAAIPQHEGDAPPMGRTQFEQFCDHMIDGTDAVNRDWLFYFCTQLLERFAAHPAPSGYQIVPNVPTPEMIRAFNPDRVLPAYVGAAEKADAKFTERYQSMLRAALSASSAVTNEDAKEKYIAAVIKQMMRALVIDWYPEDDAFHSNEHEYDYLLQEIGKARAALASQGVKGGE